MQVVKPAWAMVKGVAATVVASEVLRNRKSLEARLRAGVAEVKLGYKKRRAERLER